MKQALGMVRTDIVYTGRQQEASVMRVICLAYRWYLRSHAVIVRYEVDATRT